jgi:hypothetical protein
MVKKVCIPRSFLVINVCNQGKTLSSPCITAILCVHRIILPFSIKHVKIHKLVKLLLSLYTVVVPFALYKCSIHCRSRLSMTSHSHSHSHVAVA